MQGELLIRAVQHRFSLLISCTKLWAPLQMWLYGISNRKSLSLSLPIVANGTIGTSLYYLLEISPLWCHKRHSFFLQVCASAHLCAASTAWDAVFLSKRIKRSNKQLFWGDCKEEAKSLRLEVTHFVFLPVYEWLSPWLHPVAALSDTSATHPEPGSF